MAEWIRQIRNDDLSFLRTPYALTAEQQAKFYHGVVCDPTNRHRYWGIEVDLDTSGKTAIIGVGGITNIQWENSIGEISLILSPDFRQKGYGIVAVKTLLDMAFNQMNLRTIFGESYMHTGAYDFWEKVAEKFKAYTATLPNRKFWAGQYNDSLYFSFDAYEHSRKKDRT